MSFLLYIILQTNQPTTIDQKKLPLKITVMDYDDHNGDHHRFIYSFIKFIYTFSYINIQNMVLLIHSKLSE